MPSGSRRGTPQDKERGSVTSRSRTEPDMQHLIHFFQSIISFPTLLLERATRGHSQQPPYDLSSSSLTTPPSWEGDADTDTILSLMAALTPTPHPHPDHHAGELGQFSEQIFSACLPEAGWQGTPWSWHSTNSTLYRSRNGLVTSKAIPALTHPPPPQ